MLAMKAALLAITVSLSAAVALLVGTAASAAVREASVDTAPATAGSTQNSSSAVPYDFASAPGRLPKDVIPRRYTLALVPNIVALTVSGTESVDLEVIHSTASVQFNSLNQRLRDVRFDGKPVKAVVSNDAAQLTTVTLLHAAVPGRHVLSFAYRGKIESQPQGLFLQHYTASDGSVGAVLSTQMEATDARRMFPCWDEPAFRAEFKLTVTVPADWAAVSNMPVAHRAVRGALATVSFEPTPSMSSYLIEFTGGHLRAIEDHGGATSLGIWAVAGHEADGRTALDNARVILGDYNQYFGSAFPLPKLDSIAIPGGFSGAMENWGAITYNDQLLLVSPASSMKNRQTVFSVQAHEMAHQWFGDLVTMAWWDDIWLNESFASWRAAKETDARNPSWNWWELEDASKETAMQADARSSSHAIEQHVTNELEAMNSFDSEITYNKGQAFLRMLEAYLGENVFRDGIRRYMKLRAFSNATSADLWQSLGAASGKPVGALALDWTVKPGFPLVSVAASCDAAGLRSISATQHRFLLEGPAASESDWRVPLRVRSGGGVPVSVLLETNGQRIAAGRCDEALSVNADATGYYRVEYDPGTLAVDTRQLAHVANGDRIALLDDQWALVDVGKALLASYLGVVAAMGDNADTRAWEQISGALDTIEYAERGANGHAAFVAHARSIIKPLADHLGLSMQPGETPDVGELRRTLIGDLGRWGDDATLREARRKFEAFRHDRGVLEPDDQSVWLNIVAQNADLPTFDALHNVAREARNDIERDRYYLALAAVRDPTLAARVVEIALSDEIPPQSPFLRLRMIMALAGEHGALSWHAFTVNQKRLLEPVTSFAPLLVAQYLPGLYWDAVPLDELEGWVRSHSPAEMSTSVDRGMQTARFKLRERQTLAPAASAYVAAARH